MLSFKQASKVIRHEAKLGSRVKRRVVRCRGCEQSTAGRRRYRCNLCFHLFCRGCIAVTAADHGGPICYTCL